MEPAKGKDQGKKPAYQDKVADAKKKFEAEEKKKNECNEKELSKVYK